MSTMIERVAKAICRASCPMDGHLGSHIGCNQGCRATASQLEFEMREARAAIEAMREPTGHMMDAGYQALLEWPEVWPTAPDGGEYISEYVEMTLMWPAMIDAALSGDA